MMCMRGFHMLCIGGDFLGTQSLHAVYWRRIPMEVAATCCVLVGVFLRETPPQVASSTPSSLPKNTSTSLAMVTYFSTEQCLPNWMVTIDLWCNAAGGRKDKPFLPLGYGHSPFVLGKQCVPMLFSYSYSDGLFPNHFHL